MAKDLAVSQVINLNIFKNAVALRAAKKALGLPILDKNDMECYNRLIKEFGNYKETTCVKGSAVIISGGSLF